MDTVPTLVPSHPRICEDKLYAHTKQEHERFKRGCNDKNKIEHAVSILEVMWVAKTTLLSGLKWTRHCWHCHLPHQASCCGHTQLAMASLSVF
ncbi:hypothetical protein Ae201684_019181 [Aphanomyces euteiches]|uniref:Uncharacterized protein n=1 Tax=Aphanomyces euteiches TaxID=100861 RepID=A0A6G0W4K6_9STRA|nr:hypothetical protein Ae201684_019181 [Aphanomyces euteiches]